MKPAIFFDSMEEYNEHMRIYWLGKECVTFEDDQPTTEGIETETGNPFEVKPSHVLEESPTVKEDSPGEPEKPKGRTYLKCSRCGGEEELVHGLEYPEEMTTSCLKCGFVSANKIVVEDLV